jgi:hypothetical protein
MYIKKILIRNLRSFRDARIDFLAPDQKQSQTGTPKPKLPNVNLILANNAAGKTSLFKAIALSCLGPPVGDAGIFPCQPIRREPGQWPEENTKEGIEADFSLPDQDIENLEETQSRIANSVVAVGKRRDLEQLCWEGGEDSEWSLLVAQESETFFFGGYGATRRVEPKETLDTGSRQTCRFTRAQRVQGLFEDSFSMCPLASWLPGYLTTNPGRYQQVVKLKDFASHDRKSR